MPRSYLFLFLSAQMPVPQGSLSPKCRVTSQFLKGPLHPVSHLSPEWLCLPGAPGPTGDPGGVGRPQLEAKIAVSRAHYFKGGGGPLPSSQLELSWFCVKVWIPEF